MLTRGYRLTDIFASPYFDGATMVAKVITVAATLIWGVLVLYDDKVLPTTSYGRLLVDWAPPRVWGTGATAVGLVSTYRILRRSRPNALTWILYGSMMTGWLFVAFYLVQVRPLMPGAVATLPLIAVLSIIAFLASPRR